MYFLWVFGVRSSVNCTDLTFRTNIPTTSLKKISFISVAYFWYKKNLFFSISVIFSESNSTKVRNISSLFWKFPFFTFSSWNSKKNHKSLIQLTSENKHAENCLMFIWNKRLSEAIFFVEEFKMASDAIVHKIIFSTAF